MKKHIKYFIFQGGIFSMAPTLFYIILSLTDEFDRGVFYFCILVSLICFLSFCTACYLVMKKRPNNPKRLAVIPFILFSIAYLLFYFYRRETISDFWGYYLLFLINFFIPLCMASCTIVFLTKKVYKE